MYLLEWKYGKKIGILIDRFSNFQVFNLEAPTQNNVGNTREDINEDEVLEIIHEMRKQQREDQNIQLIDMKKFGLGHIIL